MLNPGYMQRGENRKRKKILRIGMLFEIWKLRSVIDQIKSDELVALA